MRRPTLALLYMAIFVGEAMWFSIAPLVPAFSHRFHLSKLDGGLLLASASVTILAVSIPAGMLGDRIGARRVTLAAVALMAVSDVGQGFASSFPLLIASRMLFGVAFGAVWTTGVAWLSDAAREHGQRALSLTVTVAGLGGVVGPGFAGVLVQRFGLAVPFVVAGAATGLVALALAVAAEGPGHVVTQPPGLRTMLRAAGAQKQVTASLVLMTLGGMVTGVVNLLVPLGLHANGVHTATIGLAFSASAGVFIVASALVARRAERVTVRAAAMTAVLMSLALVMTVVSTSTPWLVGFLLVRAPVAGALFAITFPLGMLGARAANLSVGAVAALLNVVWAAAALIGPVAAGALAQATGDRTTYAVLLVSSLAAAAWMLANAPRGIADRVPQAERDAAAGGA